MSEPSGYRRGAWAQYDTILKKSQEEVQGSMWMERPLPFIYTDEQDGKLHINEQVKPILERCKVGVTSIAVIGALRKGKSYILNRFFNTNNGFELGSDSEAITKGIWIWIRPHPEKPNLALILLDFEGLFDPEKINKENDMKLFCLAVLLSKVMIYNIVGVVDRRSIEDLQVVTELTKNIKIKATGGGQWNDYSLNFPELVVLMRDATLNLKVNGEDASPNEYLENLLKQATDNCDEETEQYNQIRRSITKLFIKRKCFALCKPVDDTGKLAKIETLTDDEIKQEFLIEANEMIQELHKDAEQLYVDGQKCNGSGFWTLAETYIKFFAANKIPCIADVAKQMKLIEYEKASQHARYVYAEYMRERIPDTLPCEEEQMEQWHEDAHKAALSVFQKETLFGSDEDEQRVTYLAKDMEAIYQRFKRDNRSKSIKVCKSHLAICFQTLNMRCKEKYYQKEGHGHKQYVIDKNKAISTYNKIQNKGPMAQRVCNHYLSYKVQEEESIIDIDQALSKAERDLTKEKEKQQMANYLRMEAEWKAREENKERVRQNKDNEQVIKALQEGIENLQRDREQLLEHYNNQVEQMEKRYGELTKNRQQQAEELKQIIDSRDQYLQQMKIAWDESTQQNRQQIEALVKGITDLQIKVPQTPAPNAGIPGPPRNVRVCDITAKSAKLQWDRPLENAGDVASYEIKYNTSKHATIVNSTAECYKLINLSRFESYSVTVWAISASNKKGPPSQTKEFDTHLLW